MNNFEVYIASRKQLIEDALDHFLPTATTQPTTLHQAMRYSVLAGGKLLRPLLCLASAEAVNGQVEAAIPAAAAVELLHTYTLIHDDLPAMDDDALRRGKPTNHIVYGEAQAILAGDALLTLAFEVLVDASAAAPYSTAMLIKELASATGSLGTAGGQSEDILAEKTIPTATLVSYIHRTKTAALIRAAIRLGAMCGGASKVELEALSMFGEKAGIAFQIVDDILNATSTPAQLGKAVGSDRSRHKATAVAIWGIKEAERRALTLTAEAKQALAVLEGDTEVLQQLADLALSRKS